MARLDIHELRRRAPTAPCHCFSLCNDSDAQRFLEEIPAVVHDESSPWIGYLVAVYRQRAAAAAILTGQLDILLPPRSLLACRRRVADGHVPMQRHRAIPEWLRCRYQHNHSIVQLCRRRVPALAWRPQPSPLGAARVAAHPRLFSGTLRSRVVGKRRWHEPRCNHDAPWAWRKANRWSSQENGSTARRTHQSWELGRGDPVPL